MIGFIFTGIFEVTVVFTLVENITEEVLKPIISYSLFSLAVVNLTNLSVCPAVIVIVILKLVTENVK